MFTGIITACTSITRVVRTPQGLTLTVRRPRHYATVRGASINVNGVCSTVKQLSALHLVFEYMPESMARSTIATLTTGAHVNLEQSLKVSDRLDGHLVQGHVDTIGTITAWAHEGNAVVMTLRPRDQGILRLIAEKGAVTVDGVSVTVTAVTRTTLAVKIIPYTLTHTNFAEKKKNDVINIETDVLAKYLDRLVYAHRT